MTKTKLCRWRCVTHTAAMFACLVSMLGVAHLATAGQAVEQAPARFALIVGVSQISGLPQLRPLQGVANDVRAMQALALRLGVPPKNLRVLSDTGKASTPNYAAIIDAMDWIEERSNAGSHVLIYFAGHGGQQPANPSENRSMPEYDGLDEIYFASDAGPWDETIGSARNVLTDNTLHGWLEQLRQKDVDVWLIVDMCHAGTFSRGGARSATSAYYDIVAQRGASLADIGIDLSTPRWRQFVHRGRAALSIFSGYRLPAGHSREEWLPNVSAFYATDEHSQAPEVRSRRDGEVHGLLTLLLSEEADRLLDSHTPATVTNYRLLMQRIVGRYRKDMPGLGGPTFEGVDAGKWFGQKPHRR